MLKGDISRLCRRRLHSFFTKTSHIPPPPLTPYTVGEHYRQDRWQQPSLKIYGGFCVSCGRRNMLARQSNPLAQGSRPTGIASVWRKYEASDARQHNNANGGDSMSPLKTSHTAGCDILRDMLHYVVAATVFGTVSKCGFVGQVIQCCTSAKICLITGNTVAGAIQQYLNAIFLLQRHVLFDGQFDSSHCHDRLRSS